MNEWEEKIYVEDVARYLCPMGLEDSEAFTIGARWQREQLLTDDVIERAARALVPQIWRLRDEGYESETHKQQVERSLLIARTALTEALGIEGDE